MVKTLITPVNNIIRRLYGNGNINKSVLAAARHAASMNSSQAQPVWPIIMEELDAPMLSYNDELTYAERATYTAIRLYAIHQQGNENIVYASSFSKDDGPVEGKNLFSALANLKQNEAIQVALDRRVTALLSTTNINSTINALTHLTAILKSAQKTQKIDYARLADDLLVYQLSYEQANQVRLNWGRQYYYRTNSITQSEGKKN